MANPPYEQLPDFPPKPQASSRSKSKTLSTLTRAGVRAEEKKKDFIDKVNDLNEKRASAFNYAPSYAPRPQTSFEDDSFAYKQELNLH